MSPKEMLEKAGFKMDSDVYGTIAPEPINVGKNHFSPRYRHVFIGETFNHHFYVTSHIHGKYRGYRQRLYNEHDTDLANIFGMGVTAKEAVQDFINHFTSLTYNCRK